MMLMSLSVAILTLIVSTYGNDQKHLSSS